MNRAFRDAILGSPLVQHKIELFAAGLEYNPAAGTSLADSRKAFLQYRSSIESLRPTEERMIDNLHLGYIGYLRAGCGVYSVTLDSVRLFSPGSVLRGIPSREWEIPPPIPVTELVGYCFYPTADVIAFVERQGFTCVR